MSFNRSLVEGGSHPPIMPECGANFGADSQPSQPKGDSPRPPFSGIVRISSGDARFMRRGELSTGPGPDVLAATEPAEPTATPNPSLEEQYRRDVDRR